MISTVGVISAGRLTTGYNERGLVIRSTSLNPAGSAVINEAKSAYNAFNQLVAEWQEHGGAVNTATSPKVQYSYEDGSANTIRPTGIINPDGSSITTGYSTAMASALSRPDQIKEGSSVLATLKYLGLGTLVELKYQSAANAMLTMENGSTGDAGDIYSGLDRFGRLIETIWKTGSTDLVHTKYGRNRVGGVVWQLNVKAHASSVATQDNFYWYDGLQQVTRHDRGDLTPGSGPPYTGTDPSTRQQMEVFTFDETGNWPGYFSQSPSLTQSRTHNPSNQITSISGPTGAVQPAYDPAGNMTRMPRPGDWSAAAELTWDAWNRLVKLRTPSSPSSSSSGSSSSASSSSDSSSSASGSSSSGSPASLEITYQYDALTRRTRKTNGAGTIDYYYDRQWRAVEERAAGGVSAQYVWSPLDRWTMIRRKRSVAGTLDETRYVLKDYLDPAAVIDTSAAVVERFGFDAFGPVRFMDAAFAPRAASTTGWNFLFHAEFLDADSGLYNYGYRYLHPELGRWISRDPIAEKGGMNLYGFVRNDPVATLDALGLMFGWGYGNYCGFNRRADLADCRSENPNPPPIDEVDAACFKHDCCLGRIIDALKLKCCNGRFLFNVTKADCATSPDPDKCRKAKAVILGPGGLIFGPTFFM
jgi:RHS repeat-associated protein